MEIPLEIAFEGLEPSETVAARVRQEASKLEHFYHRITSCRVVIDKPHQHHQKGNNFYVRIHVTLPGGGDVIVSREPGHKRSHSDVYNAIHDAFAAAKRQLQDAMRRRQSRTKHHDAPPPGLIAKIYPYEGYGLIAGPGGRDLYFDRDSVADGAFDTLEAGQEVVFSEILGEHGAQAVAVRAVAKRRLH